MKIAVGYVDRQGCGADLKKENIDQPSTTCSVILLMLNFQALCSLIARHFIFLVQILLPSLRRDAQQGAHSSSGIVLICVRLAITLRILAGGSVRDLMAIFGVARTTVYHVFHSTLDAVYRILSLPGIPINGIAALTASADAFETSRASANYRIVKIDIPT
jgi:hypothetical protein